MRYEVGKIYAFVKVTFINRDSTRWLSPLYLPSAHVLEKIDMRALKVTEHEKVPSVWGPEEDKQYDGYLMVEVGGADEGQVWKNQWPAASYGQLDDSSDRVVRRHFDSDSYDWDALDPAARNALVAAATDIYTDALHVLTQAYKLKFDIKSEYKTMRENMSMGDWIDFDAYIRQLEKLITDTTGRPVGMRECSYKPLGAPAYEVLKGHHEAYYIGEEEERQIIPQPTNYEEFRAYWNCLRTDEELFAYVRSETARLKAAGLYDEEGITVYCGVNLGKRSYHHSIVLKESDLRYNAIMLQTRGTSNPDFVGNVYDIHDPRIAHLEIKHNTPHHTVSSDTPFAFEIGDCDGAITKEVNSLFFTGLYKPHNRNGAMHYDNFYFTTYGLSVDGASYDDARLLFTAYGKAVAFAEWGKSDPASVIRIEEFDREMDEVDRAMDEYFDRQGDHDDNDDVGEHAEVMAAINSHNTGEEE